MTDLEIVKRCAEKMGLGLQISGNVAYFDNKPHIEYDPLHDDAQTMELVKSFRLMIWTETAYWLVADPDCEDRYRASNVDLNRAICECVARLP